MTWSESAWPMPVEVEGTVLGEGLEVAGSESFDGFFAREYRKIVGLVAVLCGSRATAEDITQEAFLAAYRRWERIGTYENPGAWVRRVAVNLAVSTARRRAREIRALIRLGNRREPEIGLPEPDEEFWAAVRSLPRRQAQCIALRYLEDRSTSDIAGLLGLEESTVRVHLHAGRTALAQTLRETVEEPR